MRNDESNNPEVWPPEIQRPEKSEQSLSLGKPTRRNMSVPTSLLVSWIAFISSVTGIGLILMLRCVGYLIDKISPWERKMDYGYYLQSYFLFGCFLGCIGFVLGLINLKHYRSGKYLDRIAIALPLCLLAYILVSFIWAVVMDKPIEK